VIVGRKMKYRVMAFDGAQEDFDTEPEARVLFNKKKAQVEKAKVTDEIKPSCNIHRCYHDESTPRRCEIIERFNKV